MMVAVEERSPATRGEVHPSLRSVGLDVIGISKRFGGARALDDVNVRIEPSTIHALIGENGAGKSTLGKIISGVLQPDRGHLAIGERLLLKSPRDALSVGIATIEQEVSLASNLSVQDNVFLGVEPRRAGVINRRGLRRLWQDAVADSGFHLSGSKLVKDLHLGLRQQVEILRAISRGADLIVMDEPTAALGRDESLALDRDIRALRVTGVSVLIISHFIKEVLALADFVTVLREGRVVRTAPARQETERSLIQAMLGRPLSSRFPRKAPAPTSQPVALEGRDLVAGGLHGVSLAVRAGEIVGVAGLDGSGRIEAGRALFGELPLLSGDIRVTGSAVARPSPRESIRRGVSLIPPSRRDDGLFLDRPILENATIGCLADVSRGGVIGRRAERRRVTRVLDQLAVPMQRGRDAVGTLSGGNQQKVLFARAMMRDPVALIAIEPTRGIDIGAKASIYSLLGSLAESGVGVLLISAEHEELIGLAHRILVLHQGRLSAELTGSEMTEERILSAAFSNALEPKVGDDD
jgi:rhamnose transport system ATP-binding protein